MPVAIFRVLTGLNRDARRIYIVYYKVIDKKKLIKYLKPIYELKMREAREK
jgi:hypothetical protein